MRIAFVGKGGAGKTTLSTLFAQRHATTTPVLAIDADINMHMAELLGLEAPAPTQRLSEKIPSIEIRTWLRGNNQRIKHIDHFKKTTPPGEGSHLIHPNTPEDQIIARFSQPVHDRLRLMTIGSYSEEGIGSSCYHNNLSILENILTHTVDAATIVVDMVAGTDAFASTLFSQFDALIFAVEPTKRSIAVFKQYQQLARAGGVASQLIAVGNKIETNDDELYLREQLGEALLGSISKHDHIGRVDKGMESLDAQQLDATSQHTLDAIAQFADRQGVSMQTRLPVLWRLHEQYIAQASVRDRFGDLTTQIDHTFTYPREGSSEDAL